MRRWNLLLAMLVGATTAIQARGPSLSKRAEVELTSAEDNQEQCSGMYSRKAWGGSVEPFILARFLRYQSTGDDAVSDPTLAFIIFEWQDEALIGIPSRDDPDERQYVCSEDAIQEGYCTNDQYGQFLLAPNATDLSRSQILTKAVSLADNPPDPANYNIVRTGYYCALTYGLDDIEYSAIVEFRNAYGELPGSQIAKLPFYGALALVYAVIGIFWAFLYVQNRHDILPVQNYITATVVFLVVEMLSTWGYYDHMNRKGSDAMSKVLLIWVSILSAARNSFSFFLLLIVCMGYGVVKTTLGKKMLYARGLAAAHFVFGLIYGLASLTMSPEDAGPLVLFVVLPLAATLTGFYVWTLNSLAFTMKDLAERKQRVKLQMYRNLWWCIIASILVIFGFFFLNSFSLAGTSDPNFTPDHWQTRWFVLDGWLNLVYLADVAYIAYLWRPTANNRRFAMSEELAQDDEGFEIASVGRDSLDMDDEEPGPPRPPPYDRAPTHRSAANGGADKSGDHDRSATPLPAPTPTRPGRKPAESLDGETIFAVGGEEEVAGFSDSDEDEHSGFKGHKD